MPVRLKEMIFSTRLRWSGYNPVTPPTYYFSWSRKTLDQSRACRRDTHLWNSDHVRSALEHIRYATFNSDHEFALSKE